MDTQSPLLHKIVLYFANSWSGGGAVRLSRYHKLMTNPDFQFIVNEQVAHGFQVKDSRVIQVRPTYLQRFFNENSIIRDLDLKTSTLFSHGAPLYPDAHRYVLHLNNTLPLVANDITLTFSLRAKMAVLGKRLYKSARLADVITVESESTRDLVRTKWGPSLAKKCTILTNGVDFLEEDQLVPVQVQSPFALTIGAYPYKRLDRVQQVFQSIKSQDPALSLVVVGATDRFQRKENTFQQFNNLSYFETRWLVANCKLYISMSETENCSISLLEAIHHKRTIICSSIPSHLEFLDKYDYRYQEFAGSTVLAEPRSMSSHDVPSWQDIVHRTYEILSD